MAEYTQNYNLKKPSEEDFYNVQDFNDNADIIDQVLKEHATHLADCASKLTTGFTLNNSKIQTPLFTFIDDDGRIETYTRLKPLLDSKGFVGCAAVITDHIDTPIGIHLSTTQLTDLKNNGWEIMSHSKSHPDLTNLTEAEIDAEIKGSKDKLVALGFDVKGFVYPYGSQDAKVRNIAKKYYDYSFGGWGLNKPPLHSSLITRLTIGEDESLTFNHFKTHIDRAIAEKSWCVFALHSATVSDAQWNVLIQIVDYLASLSTIEVVTAKTAMMHFGNVIEAWNENTDKYFAVGADGEAYSTGIYRNFQIKTPSGITESTPITSFDKNKMTVIPFLKRDNFELGAGTLIVYRDNETDDLSYQEWIQIDQKQVWRRSWNTSTNTWYAWQKYYPGKLTTLDSLNERTASDLIETYPSGLTVTQITNTTGFPTTVPGVLYTYRFALYDNGFQHQLYVTIYGDTYFRRTLINGTWDTWARQLTAKSKTYSMTAQTIPANSCLDLIIPFPGVTDYHTFSASPVGGLESNVGFNIYYYNDNNCLLRLINPTTSAIKLAARDWKISFS